MQIIIQIDKMNLKKILTHFSIKKEETVDKKGKKKMKKVEGKPPPVLYAKLMYSKNHDNVK